MTFGDVVLITLALGMLVAGFAVALWYVDREQPHALLDRVAEHLTYGSPLIDISRRPDFFDQDEPNDGGRAA